MLRDFASWVLYSPARLLAVGVPLAGLVVAGLVVLNSADRGAHESEARRVAESDHASTRGPSSAGTEHSERVASPVPIRRAARRFLDAYVVPPDAPRPRMVPTRLRKLATPALWQGLSLAQPGLLPRGQVDEITVEASGPFTGLVTVQVEPGPALEVFVVAWQNGWRISDIRPAESP
jgi:hypothetical protein